MDNATKNRREEIEKEVIRAAMIRDITKDVWSLNAKLLGFVILTGVVKCIAQKVIN